MQVGCCMYVQITEVDEAKNNVIVSEREAWVSTQICLFPLLLSFNISVRELLVYFLLLIFLNSRNIILQEKLYLREGTLLEGTVKKVLPYGAQIRIGETNRW